MEDKTFHKRQKFSSKLEFRTNWHKENQIRALPERALV
jgi:hypothetical protein